MKKKRKQRRLYTALGDELPTIAELRQISRACDRWLADRGHPVLDIVGAQVHPVTRKRKAAQ